MKRLKKNLIDELEQLVKDKEDIFCNYEFYLEGGNLIITLEWIIVKHRIETIPAIKTIYKNELSRIENLHIYYGVSSIIPLKIIKSLVIKLKEYEKT